MSYTILPCGCHVGVRRGRVMRWALRTNRFWLFDLLHEEMR